MGSRRSRSLRFAPLAILALLAVSGAAAAQAPYQDPTRGFGVSLLGVALSFLGTFALNLVVGGVAVAVAPEFVRDVVRRVRAEPGRMALYGLLAFVGGFAALIALGITIIGLIVAVPGAVVFVLYLLVTGVVSTVAVGYLIVDAVSDATLWSGLLVGALLSAALNLVPLVGGILAFVVSMFGLGAVSLRIYEGYRG